MRICGIIAEYNPFHTGHIYHIQQTRKYLGDNCAIVCVMSGNYVQRGSPAVFSKQVRAAAALQNGADVVLELPLTWSLASADRFAMGAVKCFIEQVLYSGFHLEANILISRSFGIGYRHAFGGDRAATITMDGCRILPPGCKTKSGGRTIGREERHFAQTKCDVGGFLPACNLKFRCKASANCHPAARCFS